MRHVQFVQGAGVVVGLAQERYDREGGDFVDDIRTAIAEHRNATTDAGRRTVAISLLVTCERYWKRLHQFVPAAEREQMRIVFASLPDSLRPKP